VLRLLLTLLLLVFIARAFWQIVGGVIEAAQGKPVRRGGRPEAVKLVKDPVCGTFVAPRAALSVTTSGSTHYFCSEACRSKYGRG